MTIRDEVGRLPVASKILVGGAGIIIVGIIVGMVQSFKNETKVADARLALPGQCFELAPMAEAKITGFAPLARGELLQVLQTDKAGNQSVTFVPPEIATKHLTPCRG
jgi:hypothetical protein